MKTHQVDTLPLTLNPRKPANQLREMRGALPLASCARVRSQLNETDGALTLSLMVSREDNQLIMRGSVQAQLSMLCQRCLQPVQVIVDSAFESVIVRDEDASKALPSHVDGYVCDEVIDLHDLAEEELLLALPMSPKHEQCDAIEGEGKTQVDATYQPFADLKNLIKPN